MCLSSIPFSFPFSSLRIARPSFTSPSSPVASSSSFLERSRASVSLRSTRMDRERHRWKLSCCVWLSDRNGGFGTGFAFIPTHLTWPLHRPTFVQTSLRHPRMKRVLLDTRQISRKWSHEGPRAEGKNGLPGEGRINRLVPPAPGRN